MAFKANNDTKIDSKIDFEPNNHLNGIKNLNSFELNQLLI